MLRGDGFYAGSLKVEVEGNPCWTQEEENVQAGIGYAEATARQVV